MSELFIPPENYQVDEIRRGTNGAWFELTTAGGNLTSFFEKTNRNYLISSLDVDRDLRRQRIGKGLLGVALTHAEHLHAQTMMAVIISRECLEAVEAVLGEDSVQVKARGDYAPPGLDRCPGAPAAALLWKRLG